MNPMVDGYNVGSFVQSMKKAIRENDLMGIIRAAEKFLPDAELLEHEYWKLRKEEIQHGKATQSTTAS